MPGCPVIYGALQAPVNAATGLIQNILFPNTPLPIP